MPLFDYYCEQCGENKEVFQQGELKSPECCGVPMKKKFSMPMIRIKGQGLPARKKWLDNWTPDSKPLSIGSQHGERY